MAANHTNTQTTIPGFRIIESLLEFFQTRPQGEINSRDSIYGAEYVSSKNFAS